MKKKLKISITIIVLISIISIVLVIKKINPPKYQNNDFGIATYYSKNDQDNDGIDDQSDILKNAKEYIATKPKYKSKYYANGYSNDEYGVCTDVVVNSLLEAGYNLMELVHNDIVNNHQLYNIEIIDKNIDFRRVVNLKVYFDRYAKSLTIDHLEIEKWQGGDIVVFKKHIGIISDNRNKLGIPLVIHHANPWQLKYEEDILGNRNDIVGHYRIS